MIPPKPVDPYLRIAKFFPLLGKLLEWFLGDVRRDLLRILTEDGLKRVLDVGCGTGDLSRVLADHGLHPIGMDISPAMLARAQSTAGRSPSFPLVLGDGGHLPFKPCLDAAVLRFVFHEMGPGLREALWNELSQVLRPGGLIILIDFTRPEGSGVYSRLGYTIIHSIERSMNRVHPPHYQHYRDLMEQGGTLAWLTHRGIVPSETRRYFGGNIGLAAVRV